jgi:maleate cis-trans isomerase
MGREPTRAELEHEARHTATRVELYQQRLYAGHGTPQRLAELQREAAGAAQRLATARGAGTSGH